MITPNDITILKEFFPTKEEMRNEFAEFRKDFNVLQRAVDGFSKEMKDMRQEQTILIHNMITAQKWMKPVSTKTGVKYPF